MSEGSRTGEDSPPQDGGGGATAEGVSSSIAASTLQTLLVGQALRLPKEREGSPPSGSGVRVGADRQNRLKEYFSPPRRI